MSYNFIECNRNQMYLMPPSLKEWLPESHLVWFVMDAVEQMDLNIFYEKYRADGWGHCAYEPSMMLSLLLYAYSMGERSSRQIERLCETDRAFRIVTTNQKPDHTTISRFRQENENKLEELFVSVLKLCASAGLVKVGLVALAGTKVKAHAALSANRTEEHIKKAVKKILTEAAAQDKEEDRRYGKDQRGDELPDDLKDRRHRLVRLQECQERLERESKEKADNQQAKIARREAAEAISGGKKRGRKPLSPDEIAGGKKKKAKVTDPASRIMKTAKGYVQGYNGQAVVTEEQIIVAAGVTQEENDVKQLAPMLKKAKANIIKVGMEEEMRTGLMDAGYWSENNVKGREEVGAVLIATKKDWKQRQAIREQPGPRGRIPSGLSLARRMERKLLTKRGRTLYRKRSPMIEGVFGQIKEVRGCDRFLRRGIEGSRSEWNLICATHNLLKLWRSGKVSWN